MLQRIPDRVDPWRLAEQGETLKGRLKLGSLPRLAPLLADADGEAAFVLTFARDGQRRLLIKLDVQADLNLECQRCLANMVLKVDNEICLTPVQGLIEAEQLPENLDPLMLGEGEYLDIAQLVEDELMLGIPSSPRHENIDCNGQEIADFGELPETEMKGENPFAILAGLQTNKNDN